MIFQDIPALRWSLQNRCCKKLFRRPGWQTSGWKCALLCGGRSLGNRHTGVGVPSADPALPQLSLARPLLPAPCKCIRRQGMPAYCLPEHYFSSQPCLCHLGCAVLTLASSLFASHPFLPEPGWHHPCRTWAGPANERGGWKGGQAGWAEGVGLYFQSSREP